MKAENTEALRIGLNEETLGFVSGGTEDGKIGPKDPRVKEALGFIKDAQLLVPKTMLRRTGILEILNEAAENLSKRTGFNIAKALILLKKAWNIFAQHGADPIFIEEFLRTMAIGKDIQEARKILDPLV